MKPQHLSSTKAQVLIEAHRDSILEAIGDLNTALEQFCVKIEGSALDVAPFFPVNPAYVYQPEEPPNYPREPMLGAFSTTRGQSAKRDISVAYRRLSYDRDQAANTTHRCFGAAGAPMAFVEEAARINDLKDNLKLAFKPLGSKRTVVIDPHTNTSKQVQLATAFLRQHQKSDFNLLAAYRTIPYFDEPIESLTYMQTERRSVPRLTKEQAIQLALPFGHELTIKRLTDLPKGTYLAAPKERYWRLQVRATARRRDSQGKRRFLNANGDLPILFPMEHEKSPLPKIIPPRAPKSRKKPPSKLMDDPFVIVGSQPLFLYKT